MFKKGDIVTLKKSRKKDFFARKDCLFRCGITKNMITLYKQNGERLKVVKTEDNGALFLYGDFRWDSSWFELVKGYERKNNELFNSFKI